MCDYIEVRKWVFQIAITSIFISTNEILPFVLAWGRGDDWGQVGKDNFCLKICGPQSLWCDQVRFIWKLIAILSFSRSLLNNSKHLSSLASAINSKLWHCASFNSNNINCVLRFCYSKLCLFLVTLSYVCFWHFWITTSSFHLEQNTQILLEPVVQVPQTKAILIPAVYVESNQMHLVEMLNATSLSAGPLHSQGHNAMKLCILFSTENGQGRPV